MREDPRFVAGADLDGEIVGPVQTAGLSEPFLMLGGNTHQPPNVDPTWPVFQPRLTGWRRWYQVVGAGHYRFIDPGGSVFRWGLDRTVKPQMPPGVWPLVFGDIADRESQQILVTLTTSFFDRFLRGRCEPVLTDPSSRFPEVEDRTATIGRI